MDIQATNRLHYYHIKAVTKLGDSGETLETLSWEGLPWHTRTRFNWYFNYRAALLQVKYPRATIITGWGNVPVTGKSAMDYYKANVSAKQAQVTKVTNALNRYIQQWDQIFPVTEDPIYIKLLNKLHTRRTEYDAAVNDKPPL